MMAAYLFSPDAEIPDGFSAFAKFSIGVGIDERIFTIIKVDQCRVAGESSQDVEELIIDMIRDCFNKHRKEYGDKKDFTPA